MKTKEKTSTIRKVISIVKGNERTDVKISLDDECKNGHEDFFLTADIYEKNNRGKWVDVGGGCCHDHILKLKPELKLFADLHLSDFAGCPMHGVSNAFYWLAGIHDFSWVEYHGGTGPSGKSKDECKQILQSLLRVTDSQLKEILTLRSQDELAIYIEDNLIRQWRGEANKAIQRLEEWTGKKFASKASKQHFQPVSDEIRDDVLKKQNEGYYSEKLILERDELKAKKSLEAKKQKLIDDCSEKIFKAKQKLELELVMLENFPAFKNWIFYNHKNTLSVNWTSTEKLITEKEFMTLESFFKTWKGEFYPEGVKTEWRSKPKY